MGCRHLLVSNISALLLYVVISFTAVRAVTWDYYSGSCYTIVDSTACTGHSACAQVCQSLSASLVEIETAAEMDFVRYLIQYKGGQYWVGLQYTGSTYHWTTSGLEPPGSFWVPGEPNKSGYCVRLTSQQIIYGSATEDHMYRLADHGCGFSYHAVCEKQQVDYSVVTARRSSSRASANVYPLSAPTGKSRLGCATLCAKMSLCIAFEFDPTNGLCTPYEFGLTCLTTQSSNFYATKRVCN